MKIYMINYLKIQDAKPWIQAAKAALNTVLSQPLEHHRLTGVAANMGKLVGVLTEMVVIQVK